MEVAGAAKTSLAVGTKITPLTLIMKILNIVCVMAALIGIACLLLWPYLLGLGGFLDMVIMAVYLSLFFTIGMGVILIESSFALIRDLRHRRNSWVRSIRFMAAVFFLGFFIIAPRMHLFFNMLKLGSHERLNLAGGNTYYDELMKESDWLIKQSQSGDNVIEEIPQLFAKLKAERLIVHKGTREYIEIKTSGRPFPTGWLIEPQKSILFSDENGGVVEVRKGLYRYGEKGG